MSEERQPWTNLPGILTYTEILPIQRPSRLGQTSWLEIPTSTTSSVATELFTPASQTIWNAGKVSINKTLGMTGTFLKLVE